MAVELSSSFLNNGWSFATGRSLLKCDGRYNVVRFYTHLSFRRSFPASCKMRQRNSGSRRKQSKKIFPVQRPNNVNIPPIDSEESDTENSNTDIISSLNHDIISSSTTEVDEAADYSDQTNLNSLIHLNDINTSSRDADGREELSGIRLQDLFGMIRNAERSVQALKDLQQTLEEKEALQSDINSLEARLAETDARMRVAAQQKVHVELLEGQLEKLRDELSSRGETQENMHDTLDIVSHSDYNGTYTLSRELDILRAENLSLNDDIQALKEQLSHVKRTNERIEMLEQERSMFESSLKELEFKLTASKEDDPKLSSLKSECKTLWEKVEHLQSLLDKATKQADQAILVLQQNQELRKKVERLEESLEEANVYKLSSERLQQYNELMQEKIKLLDERLARSDEEIHSYVQLYQESVKEFQDTLDSLKEESKQRVLNEPVNDMPWEFWSRLLLKIDGWFLEKKINSHDAKLLRELTWKKDPRIHDAYMECKGKTEGETISTFLRLSSSPTSSGLHVIHIAAEMAPVAKLTKKYSTFSTRENNLAQNPDSQLSSLLGNGDSMHHKRKVGGLGDVLTALSKALQKKGHLVEVILPKYDCMQYDRVQELRALDLVFESYFDGHLFKNKVWVGTVEGLPVYFIEPQHPARFFWRGEYYGEHDDFKRFSFFSRAALELIHQAGKRPDIIHCHDWQTAFVAPLYWDIYAPKGLNSARICFTCHNFEYQGTAPASELASCGLDVHHLNRPDRMQDHSAYDRVNPVKGAIVFSNIVTTVSPTYAQEVRTAEGGKGLHATLNTHSKKFVGILNGIDTDAWNPATDTYLKVQFSATDLQGKAGNKEALRRLLGLSSADIVRPLVGCITRLVPQKGVHLIRHAIYRALELGGQFVLLGSSPVQHIRREFEDIANQFQKHEHVRLILKYDESLSHSIYGASDMFIIPSIFEPCGLTQMIAMRYGAIPIARKTGGLNDSVFDIDDDSIPVEFRNGFTFLTPDEQGFNNAFERAFDRYKNDREGWQELVHKVMSIDFSWESSASQYEELYAKSVARARASRHS